MTFLAWLREQQKRDDEVGDLAADTFRFKKRPLKGDLSEWHWFLTQQMACPEAHTALDKAWKEYCATLPK